MAAVVSVRAADVAAGRGVGSGQAALCYAG